MRASVWHLSIVVPVIMGCNDPDRGRRPRW